MRRHNKLQKKKQKNLKLTYQHILLIHYWMKYLKTVEFILLFLLKD